ncbi:MAG: class III signal peptide-containing protein [Saccharolobus sp.]
MKEKNKTNRNLKGQGSTEYILMLAGVLIVLVIALVFVFKTGGTAAKSGGLQAELLGAEYVGGASSNTIAIATNIQLPAFSGATATVGTVSGTIQPSVYQVPGGYEYEIIASNSISSPITSITYTDSQTNANVLILPASGTQVSIVPNGSFPFTISQIT